MKDSHNTLESALDELYSAPMPDSFTMNWQNAVQNEEKEHMNTEKKKTRLWMNRALPLAAALVLVLGSLWVGAQEPTITDQGIYESRSASKSGSPEMMATGGTALNTALYAADTNYDSGSNTVSSQDAPPAAPEAADSRKLVRTADLTIRTAAFETDLQAVRALVSSAGGYVESSYERGDAQRQSSRSVSLYLRIPAAQLDGFLSGMEGVGRVVNRSESTTDMTVQYADNEARLATLRQKMERLNALLAQAENVADLIEIESAIADTQYAIDSYETSQRTIDRQVDMCQVNIFLEEDNPVDVTSEMSLGQRISAALAQSIQWLGRFFQNMLVFFIMALPVLIPVAALIVLWILIRRHRKKAHRPDAENQ